MTIFKIIKVEYYDRKEETGVYIRLYEGVKNFGTSDNLGLGLTMSRKG